MFPDSWLWLKLKCFLNIYIEHLTNIWLASNFIYFLFNGEGVVKGGIEKQTKCLPVERNIHKMRR